jgi:hypothetical protein
MFGNSRWYWRELNLFTLVTADWLWYAEELLLVIRINCVKSKKMLKSRWGKYSDIFKSEITKCNCMYRDVYSSICTCAHIVNITRWETGNLYIPYETWIPCETTQIRRPRDLHAVELRILCRKSVGNFS